MGNGPGGVPIRIKHLLHSPYLTLTRVISLIYIFIYIYMYGHVSQKCLLKVPPHAGLSIPWTKDCSRSTRVHIACIFNTHPVHGCKVGMGVVESCMCPMS